MLQMSFPTEQAARDAYRRAQAALQYLRDIATLPLGKGQVFFFDPELVENLYDTTLPWAEDPRLADVIHPKQRAMMRSIMERCSQFNGDLIDEPRLETVRRDARELLTWLKHEWQLSEEQFVRLYHQSSR